MASYKPNEGMKTAANRALEWRKEYGRGGTAVGVARARDIKNGAELSASTVKRMHSFFSRHGNNKAKHYSKKMPDGGPTAWRIAWDLWGGNAGASWAEGKVASMENERAINSSSEKGLQNKMKAHNESVTAQNKKVTMEMLRKVFNRGIGAYKTNPGSVRPNVKSPEQWAMARVNSFLYALKNEKFRGGKHDTDVFPKGHPLKSKGDERQEDIPMERHVVNVEETEESFIIELAKEERAEEMTAEEVSSDYDDERDSDYESMIEDMDRDAELKVEYRAMGMDKGPIDEESRTAQIALSSEEPVERSFGNEVLEHSAEAIDLSFLASGRAPLLMDHDPKQQIGVVESVELDSESRRLRAKVRFGRNGLAAEAFSDVVDGIKANISVGYAINKMEKRDKDTYVAKSWRPVEASLVSLPADVTVGVGRSSEPSQPITVTENRGDPMTEEVREAVDVAAVQAEARKAEQRNAAQIVELGARHNKSDMAQKAISEGRSIEEFRGILLDEIKSTEGLESQNIGMTRNEVKRFSLVRAINALANPHDRRAQEEAAFEFECSRAAADQYGRTAQGVMLPADVLRNWTRDINTTDDANMLTEDFRGGDFIDVLRNQSSVMQAGARILSGLQSDVKIPKKATSSSAAWLATEGANVAESEPTFSQISLSPKDLGAFTEVTRRMIQQSTLDIEALIRDDLAQAIATAMDLAALAGTGSSGQPTGIKSTSGINAVDFGTAPDLVPTFAQVVQMETEVASDNALQGNLAYILPAAMYGALKTVEKASNTAQFVIEPGGTMNGYKAIVSNQCSAGDLYFGNFSDLLVGMWGGLDVLVDPYTNSKSGTILIRAVQTMDVAVRHAVSFCLGNDQGS